MYACTSDGVFEIWSHCWRACLDVCVCAAWVLVCVFVSERETQRRERGSLSPRKSVKNSPGLCPVERFMNLSIGGVCAHVHAQRCRRAFMSMFKLSIWDWLSLWGKWTNQTDSNQLNSSTRGLPVGRGRVLTRGKEYLLLIRLYTVWMERFTKEHMLNDSNMWVNVMQQFTFYHSKSTKHSVMNYKDKTERQGGWRIRQKTTSQCCSIKQGLANDSSCSLTFILWDIRVCLFHNIWKNNSNKTTHGQILKRFLLHESSVDGSEQAHYTMSNKEREGELRWRALRSAYRMSWAPIKEGLCHQRSETALLFRLGASLNFNLVVGTECQTGSLPV